MKTSLKLSVILSRILILVLIASLENAYAQIRTNEISVEEDAANLEIHANDGVSFFQNGVKSFGIRSSSDVNHFGIVNRDNQFMLKFIQDNTISWLINNSVKMTLTNDGHLGIGQLNPSANLHVNGTTLLEGNTTVTGNLNIGGIASSFSHNYTSGWLLVGTMNRGDVWMVTAAYKNYGGSDNRGGCWIVAYSGNHMIVNQLFKGGHTVNLWDGGAGKVYYTGGGGAPATTVNVVRLSD